MIDRGFLVTVLTHPRSISARLSLHSSSVAGRLSSTVGFPINTPTFAGSFGRFDMAAGATHFRTVVFPFAEFSSPALRSTWSAFLTADTVSPTSAAMDLMLLCTWSLSSSW